MPESTPAHTERKAPRETCVADGCKKPRGNRLVVLLDPDGNDGTIFGPWCDEETDRLIKDLIPRYSDGSPTYRVERPVPELTEPHRCDNCDGIDPASCINAPTRRDLLRDLTREAVDAGTYGEPAPEMADESTINRELMVPALRDQIEAAMRRDDFSIPTMADAVLPVVEAAVAKAEQRYKGIAEGLTIEVRGLVRILAQTEDELVQQRARAEKAERRVEHFEGHAAQVNADLGIETQRAEKAEAVFAERTPRTEPPEELRDRLRRTLAAYDSDIDSRAADELLPLFADEHERARMAEQAEFTAQRRAEQAEAAVERTRAFFEDMRTWCSPYGVAADYAKRGLEVLDQPEETT